SSGHSPSREPLNASEAIVVSQTMAETSHAINFESLDEGTVDQSAMTRATNQQGQIKAVMGAKSPDSHTLPSTTTRKVSQSEVAQSPVLQSTHLVKTENRFQYPSVDHSRQSVNNKDVDKQNMPKRNTEKTFITTSNHSSSPQYRNSPTHTLPENTSTRTSISNRDGTSIATTGQAVNEVDHAKHAVSRPSYKMNSTNQVDTAPKSDTFASKIASKDGQSNKPMGQAANPIHASHIVHEESQNKDTAYPNQIDVRPRNLSSTQQHDPSLLETSSSDATHSPNDTQDSGYQIHITHENFSSPGQEKILMSTISTGDTQFNGQAGSEVDHTSSAASRSSLRYKTSNRKQTDTTYASLSSARYARLNTYNTQESNSTTSKTSTNQAVDEVDHASNIVRLRTLRDQQDDRDQTGMTYGSLSSKRYRNPDSRHPQANDLITSKTTNRNVKLISSSDQFDHPNHNAANLRGEKTEDSNQLRQQNEINHRNVSTTIKQKNINGTENIHRNDAHRNASKVLSPTIEATALAATASDPSAKSTDFVSHQVTPSEKERKINSVSYVKHEPSKGIKYQTNIHHVNNGEPKINTNGYPSGHLQSQTGHHQLTSTENKIPNNVDSTVIAASAVMPDEEQPTRDLANEEIQPQIVDNAEQAVELQPEQSAGVLPSTTESTTENEPVTAPDSVDAKKSTNDTAAPEVTKTNNPISSVISRFIPMSIIKKSANKSGQRDTAKADPNAFDKTVKVDDDDDWHIISLIKREKDESTAENAEDVAPSSINEPEANQESTNADSSAPTALGVTATAAMATSKDVENTHIQREEDNSVNQNTSSSPNELQKGTSEKNKMKGENNNADIALEAAGITAVAASAAAYESEPMSEKPQSISAKGDKEHAPDDAHSRIKTTAPSNSRYSNKNHTNLKDVKTTKAEPQNSVKSSAAVPLATTNGDIKVEHKNTQSIHEGNELKADHTQENESSMSKPTEAKVISPNQSILPQQTQHKTVEMTMQKEKPNDTDKDRPTEPSIVNDSNISKVKKEELPTAGRQVSQRTSINQEENKVVTNHDEVNDSATTHNEINKQAAVDQVKSTSSHGITNQHKYEYQGKEGTHPSQDSKSIDDGQVKETKSSEVSSEESPVNNEEMVETEEAPDIKDKNTNMQVHKNVNSTIEERKNDVNISDQDKIHDKNPVQSPPGHDINTAENEEIINHSRSPQDPKISHEQDIKPANIEHIKTAENENTTIHSKESPEDPKSDRENHIQPSPKIGSKDEVSASPKNKHQDIATTNNEDAQDADETHIQHHEAREPEREQISEEKEGHNVVAPKEVEKIVPVQTQTAEAENNQKVSINHQAKTEDHASDKDANDETLAKHRIHDKDPHLKVHDVQSLEDREKPTEEAPHQDENVQETSNANHVTETEDHASKIATNDETLEKDETHDKDLHLEAHDAQPVEDHEKPTEEAPHQDENVQETSNANHEAETEDHTSKIATNDETLEKDETHDKDLHLEAHDAQPVEDHEKSTEEVPHQDENVQETSNANHEAETEDHTSKAATNGETLEKDETHDKDLHLEAHDAQPVEDHEKPTEEVPHENENVHDNKPEDQDQHENENVHDNKAEDQDQAITAHVIHSKHGLESDSSGEEVEGHEQLGVIDEESEIEEQDEAVTAATAGDVAAESEQIHGTTEHEDQATPVTDHEGHQLQKSDEEITKASHDDKETEEEETDRNQESADNMDAVATTTVVAGTAAAGAAAAAESEDEPAHQLQKSDEEITKASHDDKETGEDETDSKHESTDNMDAVATTTVVAAAAAAGAAAAAESKDEPTNVNVAKLSKHDEEIAESIARHPIQIHISDERTCGEEESMAEWIDWQEEYDHACYKYYNSQIRRSLQEEGEFSSSNERSESEHTLVAGATLAATTPSKSSSPARSPSGRRKFLPNRLRRSMKRKANANEADDDLDAEEIKAKAKILHELSMSSEENEDMQQKKAGLGRVLSSLGKKKGNEILQKSLKQSNKEKLAADTSNDLQRQIHQKMQTNFSYLDTPEEDASSNNKKNLLIRHTIDTQRSLYSSKSLDLTFLNSTDACITGARAYLVESDKPKQSKSEIARKLFPTTEDDEPIQNGNDDVNTNTEIHHDSMSDHSNNSQHEQGADDEPNVIGETVETPDNLNKSSIVWLCTRQGHVAVLDLIDKCGECIDSFRVCASPLLCISAVPGFTPDVNRATESHEHDITDHVTTTAEQQDAAAMERYKALMGKKASNDVNLPCMWMGSESGWLYIHPCGPKRHEAIHSMQLRDAVLSIHYFDNRVYVGLVNGTVTVFERDKEGLWKFDDHKVINLGSHAVAPVICIKSSGKKLWASCSNMLHVIKPENMQVEASIQCHPRTKHYVTHVVCGGDVAWVATRKNSIIRAVNTTSFQTMKEIDICHHIEGAIGKMTVLCVTALAINESCLWIGTNIGLLLRIPVITPTAANTAVSSGVLQTAWSKLVRVCPLRHKSTIRFLISSPARLNPKQAEDNLLDFGVNSDNLVAQRFGHMTGAMVFTKQGYMVSRTMSPIETKTKLMVFSCGEGIEKTASTINTSR
ncbi:C-Jun-amino-terminal kinase-interacting protein 3, partial [Trichoplax sp. H2]